MTRGRAILAGLALTVAAAPARAAEHTHRAGDGETLESIAKNYYGATWKAVYLQTANGLTGKEPLAGRRLVIPACWTYVARRGDTMGSIAKKRLGADGRYTAVMRFNNLKDAAELEVGRELLMPFHLTHLVVAGDTFDKVSRLYYRTPKYGTLLKEYNGADVLKVGARLTIPIFDSAAIDVKARRYTAPTGAPDRADGDKPAEPVVSPALEATAQETRARIEQDILAYQNGDYAAACVDLDDILATNKAVGGDKIPLFKYLGFCAVANAKLDDARDYFRKWIELDPKASLDPVTTSPKILAVFYEVNNQPRAQPSPAEPPPEGMDP